MLQNPKKIKRQVKQDERKTKPPAQYSMAQESSLEYENEIGEGQSSGRKNKQKIEEAKAKLERGKKT